MLKSDLQNWQNDSQLGQKIGVLIPLSRRKGSPIPYGSRKRNSFSSGNPNSLCGLAANPYKYELLKNSRFRADTGAKRLCPRSRLFGFCYENRSWLCGLRFGF
jgi:hypothetical protein